MLAPCSVYSSGLMIEAICSSETPADFQRTTRRYIPEDRTVQNCSLVDESKEMRRTVKRLNKLTKAAMLLPRISEAPVSNLGRNFGYSESLPVLQSLPRDGILNCHGCFLRHTSEFIIGSHRVLRALLVASKINYY
jgi:hypothetical protein